jgi:hypothetical protein
VGLLRHRKESRWHKAKKTGKFTSEGREMNGDLQDKKDKKMRQKEEKKRKGEK